MLCTALNIIPNGTTLKFSLRAGLSSANDGALATIDRTSLKIEGSVNGGASQALTPVLAAGNANGSNRQLMLLLDTSQSMRQPGRERFTPEIDAAKKFVDLVAASGSTLKIGIVTFGDQAEVKLEPADKLTTVSQMIDKIRKESLSQKTDLYGAVLRGIGAMTEDTSRYLLMITDGTYDPPKPSQERKRQLRQQIQTALAGGKTKNIVTFQGVLVGNESRDDINAIGPNISIEDSNLGDALVKFVQSSIDQQARTVDVSVRLPDDWAGTTPKLVVAGKADGVNFSTVVQYPIPPVAAEPTSAAPGPVALPVAASSSIPFGVLIAALIAVFAALAILLTSATGALAGADNKKSAVIRRLELYTVSGGKPARVEVTEQTTRLGDSALTRSAVNLMTRFARRSRMDDALDGQLEAAGLPLRTAEWMLLHIGIAVLGALLLVVISGGQIAAGVVGLLLGIAGPWIFLTLARSRRESKFLAQLPDTLQLLAGSLAAGYSLPQAMDSVVRESHPPISVEFNRALVEARLGMLAEDALDGIAQRTGSTDFSWIVMAIRIQRDVGGNLAELLSSVADTLRERERLRRQVDALSAEGRLSGAILGALPLVFGLYLLLTRPEYIAPLFNTQLGLVLLAIGGVMLIVGGFWMSRVIKVKV